MGAQAWTASEPPLTIGRGLTAVTGTIGFALALAVLWTMLPTHAGRTAISVRSTVANALLFPTTPTSSSAAEASSPPTVDTPVSRPPATTAFRSASTVKPPAPLPTYALAVAGTPSTDPTPPAVAVAVNNGSLVLTTANAVSEGNTVDLMLPGGGTEQAKVLLVDQRNGFAVLAHDAAPSADAFIVAPSVQPGDQLTFYGVDGLVGVVQADGSITTNSDPQATDAITTPDLPEGTPVVNQRGELVALCSHDDDGPTLVTLTNLDALRRALDHTSTTKVRLGVTLADDPAGAMTIGQLDPNGPAAAAGLRIGDAIVSIDGISVLDVTAIGATLANHSPGDAVSVTVLRDAAQLTVMVTLQSNRPAV
jgi:S1-C subfamily serine protease